MKMHWNEQVFRSSLPSRSLQDRIPRFLFRICALVLCLASQMSVSGQVVTGTLTGSVKDSTGAVIENATVTVTQVSTNVVRTATTTKDGMYNFPFLNPDHYRVKVDAGGFKTLNQENIEVPVSTVTRFDATLVPGSAAESITVTDIPPALQTESAEVSTNFQTRSVTDTPLPGRSLQGLATLAPGVSMFVVATGAENPSVTALFNANGQSFTANSTLIDGVDNTDPFGATSIYIPAPEIVEEVHVSTSNYSAEFGRVAGALITASTRHGGNQFHGTLWEYNQVAALAARNWSATTGKKPPLTQNDFGATVGGPIKKDKVFFFGAYSGLRIRRSSTNVGTTPLPAFLNGDFSSVPGALIYNPFSGTTTGAKAYTDRTAFANNIITPALISTPAKNINKYFPAPNRPGIVNNYVSTVPYSYNGSTGTGRIDYNFSERTKLSATTNISSYTIDSPTALPIPLGDGTTANDNTDTGIVNLTHAFSPTLLGELRLAYNLFATNVVDPNKILNNAQAGISDPNPYPISIQGLASIHIAGLGGDDLGGNTNYPLKNRDNLYQIVTAWTKDLPNHSFKWGGEIHNDRLDRRQPQGFNGGPRGAFNFQPGTTQVPNGSFGANGTYINAFAAYLLGVPQQTSRTYMTQTPTNRQWQIEAFFQDTWHPTPKLTLNLGMREEFYSAVGARGKGGASNYDPTTNNLLVAGYGKNNLANNVSNQSLVEPRVGFAYRITSDSVIRGGFAMSGWAGAYGFTGGTLSTQFPVIYNIQNGNTGGYGSLGDSAGAHRTTSIPVVSFITIPANGAVYADPTQQAFVIPKRNPIPYVETWNLFYERSFKHGFTANIGYVGNVGRHNPSNIELNAAAPGTGTAGLPLNTAAFHRTASTQLRTGVVPSNYNALQSTLVRNFSNGFSLTVAYAYSKALDYGSNQPGFRDNLNLARQYGPGDTNRTHNLTLSHIYELPFGKGKPFLNQGGIASYLASGWQLNGVLTMASGLPFTIGADSTSCNCPGNDQYANQVTPVHYLRGIGPGKPWFSTSSFAPPQPNTFGNVARNSVVGPSLKQYDFSLFRTLHFMDRFDLQARGEFFNLTNTPNFSNPDGNVTDANFGIISSTYHGGNQRRGQLALKLLF